VAALSGGVLQLLNGLPGGCGTQGVRSATKHLFVHLIDSVCFI